MNIFKTVAAAVKRTLAISKKNIKIYYLKPQVLNYGLLFPVVMSLAFVIGRGMEPAQLTPSILGVAVLFTASAVGPLISPWERMMKTYERVLAAPVSLWNNLLGDIISGFCFGLLISVVPLLMGRLFLGVPFFHPTHLVIALVMSVFCFSALGSLISALPTEMPQPAMMLATLIRFPLVLVSGIFIPLPELPAWAYWLAYLSPLTYAVDLFRWTLGQGNYLNIYFSYFLLLGFIIVLILGSKAAHQKGIEAMY